MNYSLNFIILFVTLMGLAVSIYLAIEIRKLCKNSKNQSSLTSETKKDPFCNDDNEITTSYFSEMNNISARIPTQRFNHVTYADDEITQNMYPIDEFENNLQNKGYGTLCFDEDTKTNLPSNTYTARQRQLTIGRHKDNKIIIQNTSVSRHHCVLTFDCDKAFIEDLDTVNGTYIDGERIYDKMPLPSFCTIALGAVSFTLELSLQDITTQPSLK